jgi:hypothetical protein
MSAAKQLEPDVSFEDLVDEGFEGTREGAVIIVESRGVPFPRQRWLARQLEGWLPGGVVHQAESLFVVLMRHAGAAETWMLVERLRRQLKKSGWDHVVVGSASWPMQGSTPMDVVAAALASLSDERERSEREWAMRELWFEVDASAGGFNWASAGELLTG